MVIIMSEPFCNICFRVVDACFLLALVSDYLINILPRIFWRSEVVRQAGLIKTAASIGFESYGRHMVQW